MRKLRQAMVKFRADIDFETRAPDRIGLGGKRRKQCRKKLVAHRNPFRDRDIFLVKGSLGALAQTEKSATATKPANIDALRLSSDAPHHSRVRRIILRVNRSSRPERNKVTRASVRFSAAILKVDIHFSDKVVFVLWRLLKEELLPDGDLLGGRVLEPHYGIRLRRCAKFGERRCGWLLNKCADRCALC